MVDNRNPLYDFGDEGEGEAPTFNEKWGSLPVEAPHFNLTPNVALVESTPKPLKQGTDPVTGRPDLKFVPVDDPWANTPKPIKRLLGVGGEERYQTWPERALRSGLSAPLDALTGRMQVNDPETGMPTDEAIRRSQDVASVGGPGGLMNLEEKGVLGSHGGNLVQPMPKVAAPFYSAVEHAVSNIKQDKMPADQWLGTLTNSKGVKPEELDWTGLKDHLAEKGKEPVTKQEVQDYVNANKVELKEVNKEQFPQYKRDLQNLDNEFNTKYGETWPRNENVLSNEDRQKLTEARGRIPSNQDLVNPKYSRYQLPGGENYKEMLVTLPEKPKPIEEFAKEYYENFIRKGGEPKFEELPLARQQQLIQNAPKGLNKGEGYTSSHWDEPNVLAHVRTNDRNITAPGETIPKKSLHIEEIQSDWHQAGRDKGYKNTPLTKVEENELIALDKKGDEIGWTRSEDERYATLLERKEGRSSTGIPNAPFKKTWHELALKRMIREAAEKGYDRLSWTPGGANKTNPKVLGQTGEQAEKADRGLKKFYDEIIPQAIEKIGKEHGVKVKQAKTEGTYDEHKVNKDSYDPPYRLEKKDSPDIISRHKTAQEAWDKAEELTQRPVHYIDIPESLKNQALGKGFPLFSSGGHLLNPIPGNPHEQVDNSHHVPYGAGASNTPTGFPVNIDKRIPKYDDKLKLPNGQPADLHKYLTIHEIEEYKAMKAGIPYHKAHHEIATPMEKKAVESDGVSWKEYEHIMDGYLKETEEGGYKNLPPHLYTKPYPHSRSLKMDHGESE